MSPSLPTPAFLYILNILLSPTLPKFPVFPKLSRHPQGTRLATPPPQNSEGAPDLHEKIEKVCQMRETIYLVSSKCLRQYLYIIRCLLLKYRLIFFTSFDSI